jgi:prepilin-type N-terminal cleavage/methylation domain-containing protein
MFSAASFARRGFSLIELVIVVVIIGIIGAIAIPRMSRGVESAGDSALSGNLAVLRAAIDLYSTEHGGTYPAASTIVNQLTLYSDDAGATSATKDSTHI